MAPLREIGLFIRNFIVPDVRSRAFWIGIAISAFIVWRLEWELWQAAVLYVLILVHEIGHTVGIYCLGYTPNRIHLNLAFGLAGMKERARTREDTFIIVLLGPLFGFMFAIFTGILYYLTGHEVYHFATLVGLIINLFNLIPIYPFDGGQLFHSVSMSLHKKGGVILSVIVGIGMLVIAFKFGFTPWEMPLTWLFAGFGLYSLWAQAQEAWQPVAMRGKVTILATMSYLGLAALLGGAVIGVGKIQDQVETRQVAEVFTSDSYPYEDEGGYYQPVELPEEDPYIEPSYDEQRIRFQKERSEERITRRIQYYEREIRREYRELRLRDRSATESVATPIPSKLTAR